MSVSTTNNTISKKENLIEELEALFIRERARIPYVYLKQSPQLDHRRKLVDFICDVGQAVGLSTSATSLAIYFYNYFEDWHSIEESQLYSVALAAIRLAGKVNHNTPFQWSGTSLSLYLPGKEYRTFSTALLLKIEVMMATHFSWRLMLISPADFLDLYKMVSVTKTDILFEASVATFQNNNRFGGITYNQLKNDMAKLDFFVDGCKNDVNNMIDIIYTVVLRLEPSQQQHHTPSLIAGAVLILARIATGLQLWNTHFRMLTRHSAKDVLTCCNDYILEKGGEQLKKYILVNNATGKLNTSCVTEAFEAKVCHETRTVILRPLRDDMF